MTEIALALGGGGVKGVAHLGVIRCLEQAGFKIRAIAGTSAGGLIGSIYAAGYTPDEIVEVLSKVDQKFLFKRNSPEEPSLLGLQGVTLTLTQLLGSRSFDDLSIPFGCTAVDLETSLEVILTRGRVIDAVLATIAVPGIFPPMQINGARLIDGAVLDPVPVSLARWLAPTLPVVAVCLSPSPRGWAQLKPLTLPPNTPIPAPIIDQFARLRVGQAFQIYIKAIETTSHMLAELRMQIDKPEVIIRPDVDHIGYLDPINPQDLIAIGEQAACEKLQHIRESLSVINQLNRKLRRTNPLQANAQYLGSSPLGEGK
ncbi:MAG: patatin-like phospholipase family protein [Anaerolineaceae bacterium]|nr:patatin-like phospholipase family protein [Anaerolineaceae bacterium]